MRLRTQLLLLAMVALVLPWAGWQFVRGLEVRLRDEQAAALADSAGVLAGAIAASLAQLPEPGPVWFVHAAPAPLTLDGDDADWGALRQHAQRFGSTTAGLQVVLAHFGGAVHVLAEAADDTPLRRDAGGPGAGDGDALRLLVDDGVRVHAMRFASARDGSVQPLLESGAVHDAPRVLGAWRAHAGGWRVELRLPAGLQPRRLGIEAVDARIDGAAGRHGSAPDRLGGLWPLVRRSPALSRQLAAMLPAGLRARLLHPQGWVIAEAGALAPPAQSASSWPDLLHGVLPTPVAGDVATLDPIRVDPQLLAAALDDGALTLWQRSDGGMHLQLAALAPVAAGAAPRAVVALERRSDAALLAREALSGLLGWTLLAMLAVGAVLFGYASWLGQRVRRLGRAVDMAMHRERGLPAPFVPSRASDELGELSRRFARLLEEVGGHTEYLRNLASKLSHELHTPLAVVRGSLENLDAQAIDADSRAYVQRAGEGARRLSAIIRAMSEATRVERAIASADPERVDVAALVAGCADGYRPLLAPRRLELELPATTPRIDAAPELLAQALDKLVENAHGFCPPDGWIRIAVAASGEQVEIAVANSGPLLPPGPPTRLFDSLVSMRAAGARGDGTPHLGLGLHIVRLIVELHRGSVAATNLAGGTGVEFRLRLRGMVPAGASSVPPPPVLAADRRR